jgi:hypothetical protein
MSSAVEKHAGRFWLLFTLGCEYVKFGYTTVEIAKLDGVGGEGKPVVVAFERLSVASHAPEEVGPGCVVQMVGIQFAGRTQAVDQC